MPLPPGANARDRWLDLADQARDKARAALSNGDRRMAELWDEHERTLLRNAYEDVPHPDATTEPATGRAPTGTLADLIGPIGDRRADIDPGFVRPLPPGSDDIDPKFSVPLPKDAENIDPGFSRPLPASLENIDPGFKRAQAKTTGNIPPLPKPKPASDEQVPGGKKDPWPESLPGAELRNELHKLESPSKGYGEDLPQLGRYQMTVEALQDVGLMDENGNWTGKYGIHNKAQFLDNKKVQEQAFSEYLTALTGQLERNGAMNLVRERSDRKIQGINGAFGLSQSGLIAAAHRRGASMVRQYLEFEKAHGWKSNAAEFPAAKRKAFLEVETRLRKFENIPLWRADELKQK
jgi:hypothetical protein